MFILQEILAVVNDLFGISYVWGSKDLESLFTESFHKSIFSLILIFISRSIWITQNKVFFQNISPDVMSCGIRGISLFNEYVVFNLSKKTKKIYFLGTTSFCAKGFFGGFSSNSSGSCGMVHSLNKDHYFTLCLGGGKGTNTKAKLMRLWGLLQFFPLLES